MMISLFDFSLTKRCIRQLSIQVVHTSSQDGIHARFVDLGTL